MKTVLRFSSVMFICVLVFYNAAIVKCFAKNTRDIHVVTSHCGEEHTLRNVPEDLPFVPKFPMEQLLSDPSISDIQPLTVLKFLVHITNEKNEIDIVRFYYRIFTSISDAEFYNAGLFCGRVAELKNALYLGREGEIGDNCWYGGNGIVNFIRNNVVVYVGVDSKTNDNSVVLKLAQKIDTLLVNSEKVNNDQALQSPVIHSVDVVSGKPEVRDKITLKVNATDPNNQVLRYFYSGQPWAIKWQTGGILELPRFIDIEAVKRTYIIWAMNEDYIISSPTKISFLIPSAVTEEGEVAETPQAFTLYQNAPNPFNPGTVIGYELALPGQVSLRIYDLLGREVAVLVEGMKDSGYHEAAWNGRDSIGKPAASGIYLYRLDAGGHAETRRMMLVR